MTHRSQASIASEILGQNVLDKAYRARAIQEAMVEAQQGQLVSQHAVEEWVASLGTDNELPMPTPDLSANALPV